MKLSHCCLIVVSECSVFYIYNEISIVLFNFQFYFPFIMLFFKLIFWSKNLSNGEQCIIMVIGMMMMMIRDFSSGYIGIK